MKEALYYAYSFTSHIRASYSWNPRAKRNHYGAEGSDNTQLHRIQRSIVEDTALKAGFLLEDSSDILRNSTDPMNVVVFDPAVRGHTDRFVLRLRKPRDG